MVPESAPIDMPLGWLARYLGARTELTTELLDTLLVLTGYRRRVVERNLGYVFPEWSTSRREQIANASLRQLATTFAQTIALMAPPAGYVEEHLKYDSSIDDVLRYQGTTPFIGLTGHLHNWEMTLLGLAARGVPHRPVLAAYEPLHNPLAERVMRQVRSQTGATLVPGRHLLRELARQRAPVYVAMVADQSAHPDKGIEVKFFGHRTHFFPGPVKIASRIGATVWYLGSRALREGVYELYARPLWMGPDAPDAVELMQAFATSLEENIRSEPAGYLWTHRRFKHQIKY